jgi:hypothetical protein
MANIQTNITKKTITYQCGVCGNTETHRAKTIFECFVCHIPLCYNCDKNGLCPTHLQQLSSEDQNRIQIILKPVNSLFRDYFIACIISCIVTIIGIIMIPIFEATPWWGGIVCIISIIFMGINARLIEHLLAKNLSEYYNILKRNFPDYDVRKPPRKTYFSEITK